MYINPLDQDQTVLVFGLNNQSVGAAHQAHGATAAVLRTIGHRLDHRCAVQGHLNT